MSSFADKKRALQSAINSLKKKYDGCAIQVGKEAAVIEPVEPITTGSALIDNVIGIGGFPKGRIVEIYGLESSGKTTLSVLTCIQAQMQDTEGYVGYVDQEHAFHKEYYQGMGLDLERLIFSQPNSGEEALETVEALCRSGLCSVVVMDSIGALLTKTQLEKGIGEATMGEVARLLSQNLQKINTAAKATNTLVIFINQIRSKMVMMGNPETTMGGNALKFYASVRLDIRKTEVINDSNKNPIGQKIRVKVVKNKVGPPFGVVETDLFFYRGFDSFNEVVSVAIDKGIIPRSGAWYNVVLSTGELSKDRYQGKDNVLAFYKAHTEDFEALKRVIMNTSNIATIELPTVSEAEDQEEGE